MRRWICGRCGDYDSLRKSLKKLGAMKIRFSPTIRKSAPNSKTPAFAWSNACRCRAYSKTSRAYLKTRNENGPLLEGI